MQTSPTTTATSACAICGGPILDGDDAETIQTSWAPRPTYDLAHAACTVRPASACERLGHDWYDGMATRWCLRPDCSAMEPTQRFMQKTAA